MVAIRRRGAGHEHLGADAGAGELEVQRLGEQLERRLARRVRTHAEGGGVHPHRRHVHDVAPAPLDHAGHDLPAQLYRRQKVDPVDGVDVGRRLGREVPDVLEAGVVDEDVDRARFRLDPPDQTDDLLGVEEIGRERLPVELAGQLLERALGTGDEGDPGSRGRKRPRQLGPDPP